MRRLEYIEFQREQEAFDRALTGAGYLARFCSAIPWQCAAYENLHGPDLGIDSPGESWIVEENGNWMVLAKRRNGIFFPFESAWMFGCPLVGDPADATALLLRAADSSFPGRRIGVVIPGVRSDSEMFRQLSSMAENSVHSEIFSTTDCMTIDLSSGVEGFLERRSRSFRKSLRQIKPLAGLEIEDASSHDPSSVLPRIISLQARSHKAPDGGDLFATRSYGGFYENLYRRLFRSGQIRTFFAKQGAKDIAYIMGGVWNHVYRGFQMTYDQEFHAYSLGNILQLENMRRVAGEGVTHYDLGMHSPYKERWADSREEYRGFFIVR